MQYKHLSNGKRKLLEENFVALIRYESLVGRTHLVDDAVLKAKDSSLDVNKMDGYSIHHPKVWFEFVSQGKSTKEAVAMVDSGLEYLEKDKQEPKDPRKSECPECGKMLVDVDKHVDRVHSDGDDESSEE